MDMSTKTLSGLTPKRADDAMLTANKVGTISAENVRCVVGNAEKESSDKVLARDHPRLPPSDAFEVDGVDDRSPQQL